MEAERGGEAGRGQSKLSLVGGPCHNSSTISDFIETHMTLLSKT